MEALDFKTAFKFPFNRPVGMLNILWVLIPIVGWFALGGYMFRNIQGFMRGQFQELPLFDFVADMKLGFWMFVKALPFMILYTIVLGILGEINEWLLLLRIPFEFLIFPILMMNFVKKGTAASLFEFDVSKVVFEHFSDYVTALVKSFFLAIVFAIMMLVLVGIPAGAFTNNMFLADFYRRNVKDDNSDPAIV